MRSRGLAITVAVVLALLGTAGILAYVNKANARALAGQKAVTVLVAKQLIPAGTTAKDAKASGLLGTEKLPAASVPADALTGISPGISTLVTDGAVQPGQLLIRPMLVASAQVTTGFAIPSGKMAVSLLFCLPEAVAGNVRPGAQVAVFNTVISSSGSSNSGNSNVSAATACTGPHQATAGVTATTKLILPKVTVLAVGPASSSSQSGSQSAGTASSSSQSTALLTVAVSQKDAERLIAVTQNGLPYLALVNASSDVSVSTTGASGQGG